jgi:hypothetical protein
MSYSLCLLTASLLTGQQPAPSLKPADASVVSTPATQIIRITETDQASPPVAQAVADPGAVPPLEIIRVSGTQEAPPPPPPSPRLLDRIRTFFSGRREEPAKVQTGGTALQTGGTQVPMGGTPVPVGGTAQPTKVTTLRPHIEMTPKELEKVGHDQDYGWITGKLARVAGGHWVLYYAGPYEVDRYDGCVMLAPRADMGKFHDGDLVCVVGRVLPTRAPRPHAGAVYEATEINLIEAPNKR